MADETVIRTLNSSVTILSKPFSRFGIFRIGGRSSIVKLRSNNLAIFSPVAITPAVRRKVDELGNQVKYLIAPDYVHHLYIGEWKKTFPQAQVIGVEGLPTKKNDVKFDYVFTKKEHPTLPKEFTDEFDCVYFSGFVNKDLCMFHKPSKTLLVADLLFNLPAHEQYSQSKSNPTAGLSKLFNMLSWRSTMHKRFLWYLAGADRASMIRDAKTVAAMDKQTIVPCHGDVVHNANQAWNEVYSWFLTS